MAGGRGGQGARRWCCCRRERSTQKGGGLEGEVAGRKGQGRVERQWQVRRAWTRGAVQWQVLGRGGGGEGWGWVQWGGR